MHGNVKWNNDAMIDIMRRRLEGATLQEIGDEYGCSRENIRQLLGRGMRIMKSDCRYAEFVFPNIRDRMVERKITMYQIAKDTGIAYNSIAMWFKGRNDVPLRKARAIARYFGMTIDEAFQLADTPTGDA